MSRTSHIVASPALAACRVPVYRVDLDIVAVGPGFVARIVIAPLVVFLPVTSGSDTTVHNPLGGVFARVNLVLPPLSAVGLIPSAGTRTWLDGSVYLAAPLAPWRMTGRDGLDRYKAVVSPGLSQGPPEERDHLGIGVLRRVVAG